MSGTGITSYLITPYMGNIGGRSSGCITCRRKRITCDERRPACSTCIFASHTCEGYRGLPITFDPHEDMAQRPTPSQQASAADEEFTIQDHNPATLVDSSSRDTSLANLNGVIRRPPRGRPRKTLQGAKKAANKTARQNTSDRNPRPPFELNYAAFQEPICVTFLVQKFLGHLDTGEKSLLPAWNVDNVSGTARDSVNALALAFFGKAHHQHKIVYQGAECYGKALIKLAHDLDDPNAKWSASVLLSCILLARYELVASTGSAGWIRHAGGVERLIELRGPWRHQSPQERQFFEAARPIIAIKAITDCKRTFLEQEDWLTIPWAQDPSQKSYMNQLMDIFCIIPGLLEDSKRLHTSKSFVWDFMVPTSPSTGSSTATQDPCLVALRHRTQDCYEKLQRWKETWDRCYPSAIHPVKPSHFPRSDLRFPEDIFSYALDFPNFQRACEYQLYNTLVFFLASLMLSVPPTSQGDFLSPPSVSDLLTQRFTSAYDVCRTVPYDMFDKHGGGGPYLLLFPLLTNLRLFGEGSDEGKWIKHVLARIAKRWGLEGERKYMTPEG